MTTKTILRARALDDKAADLQAAGDYRAAEEPLTQAIMMWKLLYGAEHLEVLHSEMNLAVSFRRRGDADLAVPILERVVRLLEPRFGEDDVRPFFRLAVNNLAITYLAVGRVDDAGANLMLYLDMLEAFAPGVSEERARVLDNLSVVLSRVGNLSKAEEHARLALADWIALRGADDVDSATAAHNLGFALLSQGRLDEAAPHLDGALAILEAKCGGDHPKVGEALVSVAKLCALRGDGPRAVDLLQRAIAIGRARLSGDHPLVADAVATLALVDQGGFAGEA